MEGDVLKCPRLDIQSRRTRNPTQGSSIAFESSESTREASRPTNPGWFQSSWGSSTGLSSYCDSLVGTFNRLFRGRWSCRRVGVAKWPIESSTSNSTDFVHPTAISSARSTQAGGVLTLPSPLPSAPSCFLPSRIRPEVRRKPLPICGERAPDASPRLSPGALARNPSSTVAAFARAPPRSSDRPA